MSEREPGDDEMEMKSVGELLAEQGFTPRPPTPIDWSVEIPRRQSMFLESSMGVRSAILKAVGAPAEMVDKICDVPDRMTPNFVLDEVRVWQRDQRPLMLVLRGDPQRGKTFAAVYAMSLQTFTRKEMYPGEPWIEITRFGSDQFFTTAATLATLKAQWDGESVALVKRLKSVRLLVVDDLGAEWAEIKPRLEEVLLARHARGLRTILTTNLTDQALPTQYGLRLFERIQQNATVLTV